MKNRYTLQHFKNLWLIYDNQERQFVVIVFANEPSARIEADRLNAENEERMPRKPTRHYL